MKKYLFMVAGVAALMGALIWQFNRINTLKEQRDLHRNNEKTLLVGVQAYKTKDSLNAVQVGELSLRIKEFNSLRTEDAKLIETLRVRNRDLAQVTASQLETIHNLKGAVRDSLIYVDNVVTDTLKCVSIKDTWFALDGCIKKDIFEGKYTGFDSLLYVETVKYRRFLGFLWKTKRVEDRKQDLISRNPNTKILNAEFITIRK